MRGLAALALLLAATPVHARPAGGFCADLHMVVESAREREPFETVTFHENWDRFAVLETCRPNRLGPVDRVQCSWQLASAEPVLEALVAEALRCLPGAIRDDPGAPGGRSKSEARLRLGGLTIHIDQSVSAPGVLADTAAVMVLLVDE